MFFKAVTRNITLIRIIFDNLQFHDSIVACKSKSCTRFNGIKFPWSRVCLVRFVDIFRMSDETQMPLRLDFAFLDFRKFINL